MSSYPIPRVVFIYFLSHNFVRFHLCTFLWEQGCKVGGANGKAVKDTNRSLWCWCFHMHRQSPLLNWQSRLSWQVYAVLYQIQFLYLFRLVEAPRTPTVEAIHCYTLLNTYYVIYAQAIWQRSLWVGGGQLLLICLSRYCSWLEAAWLLRELLHPHLSFLSIKMPIQRMVCDDRIPLSAG